MNKSCKTCKHIRVGFDMKGKFYECYVGGELSYPVVCRCWCDKYESKYAYLQEVN